MSAPADDDSWDRWSAASYSRTRYLIDGAPAPAEWFTVQAVTSATTVETQGFVELPAGSFHRTEVVVRDRDGRQISAETRFVSARGMRL